MNELVSVICTVKNGANTISETIESVIKQSYINWEFIIIDDGSTDNTSDILKEYALKDKRIKIHFSGGIGRSKALNKAISLSNGEYIANIDSDDLMHSRKIEIQLKYFLENRDFFLFGTNSVLIYNNQIPNWGKKEKTKEFKVVDHNILIRNQISHITVMMKKSDLLELEGYNENIKMHLDYDLWLRAFTKKYKMGIIQEDLGAKRIHKNQSYENKKRVKYVYKAMLLQLKYIVKNTNYIFFLPVPIVMFFLSLLPFKTRRKIIKYAKKAADKFKK